MNVVRFFLSGVCHQLADHCLYYQGQPLPLCARCMGTFVGIVATLGMLRVLGERRRSELPSWPIGLALGGLLVWWAMDGVNSFVSSLIGTAWLYEPSNELRLLTGLGSGLALGIVLYPIYHFALWQQIEGRRVLDPAWHLLIVVGGVLAIGLIAYIGGELPFVGMFILAAGSVAIVLALVNGLLLALIWHQRGQMERWTQVIPYLLAGLAAALLETGTLATVRWLLGNWLGG